MNTEFFATLKAALVSFMGYAGITFAYASGFIPKILWFISTLGSIALIYVTIWSMYIKMKISIDQERDRKAEIRIRKENKLPVRRKRDDDT